MLQRTKRNRRNGQSDRDKYSKDQIIKAMWATGGFKTQTAKKLRCTLETLGNYFKRYPELEETHRQIEESHLDLAESKLSSKIKAGNLDATKFYLKTKGKRRGYTERSELAGVSDAPLTIKIVPATGRKKDDGDD